MIKKAFVKQDRLLISTLEYFTYLLTSQWRCNIRVPWTETSIKTSHPKEQHQSFFTPRAWNDPVTLMPLKTLFWLIS